MKRYRFGHAVTHVRYELDRFERVLLKLQSHDYPSNAAYKLIDAEKLLIDSTRESIAQIIEDYELDPSGCANRLVSEYRKLVHRRRQLDVLARARSDEIPWSLVPSVERLAAQLLPQRHFLITATADMNYMISWSTQQNERPVTLYLPRLHRGNAFLHTLIGHELFHPLIDEFLKPQAEAIKPRLRIRCSDALREEEKVEGELGLFFQPRLDQVLGFALEMWSRGLTELMCDMGMAAIFGPSALWTLAGFAAIQMDTEPSRENSMYPPWGMRVAAVRNYLSEIDDGIGKIEELGRQLVAANLPQHAQALSESMEEEFHAPSSLDAYKSWNNRLSILAYEAIQQSMAPAMKYISEKASGVSSRWTQTLSTVPSLVRRLGLLVPPSEILKPGKQASEPAEWSAISIACWIERLENEQADPIALDLARFQRLSRLMLKANEDAELKRLFCNWKKRGGL